MTIQPNGEAGVSIRQTFSNPLVYLDHWAVRLFSNDEALADRFIAALHAAQGTWLFSHMNLSEFTAMRDIPTARSVETLLQRAFPYFYVLDTVSDTPYFREDQAGRPGPPEAPDTHWMLRDLCDRAVISGGTFNAHRFISDAIDHADELMPIFEQMKRDIANHITAIRQAVFANQDRRTLVPDRYMRLIDIFKEELLVEPAGQANQRFRDNDAVDFVHALPACQLCDMVLLDTAWCHKVALATLRIREAGIECKIAACYSSNGVDDFLAALEAESR
ncbi:MAG: hypothetical protein B7Y41_08670 [Hydrogenophilales bacterium 28-61-23]|nr:MAG: hypothetical protein B7Y41_08670 [Hydrogenophilales bacterium 28-61-23]